MGILTTAFAGSWMVVISGYVLCGVGVGVFQPAAYGLAVELTESRYTARNLGRINIGWAGATLVGVPLAGSYAALVGWRLSAASFFILWVIVVLFIWKAALKSTHRSPAAKRNRHWSRATLKLMAQERLHWLYFATVLVFIGFYGVYIYLGMEIRSRLGSSSLVAGGFVFFYGLGFLSGSLLTSRIDRFGYRNTLMYACLMLGLTLLCIPVVTSIPVLLAILMFVWGVHQVAAFTSITALAGSVDKGIKGRALSIKSSMVMFGASMGIFLMGYVNAEFGFRSVGIACALASFAAASVAGLRLKRIVD